MMRRNLLSEIAPKDTKEKLIEVMRKLATEIQKLHLNNEFHGKLSPFSFNIDCITWTIHIKPNGDCASDEEWTPFDQSDPKKSDVFALGCVFYYLLTKGQHPFGEPGNRSEFISRNLYLIEECENKLAENVIEKMIAFEASRRPSISQVLKHPVFWSEEDIANYLKLVAERFGLDQVLESKLNQFSKKVVLQSSRDIIKRKKNILIKRNSQILEEIRRIEDQDSILLWHKLFPDLLLTVYSIMEEPFAIKDGNIPIRFGDFVIGAGSLGNVVIKDVKYRCQMRFGRFNNDAVYIFKLSERSLKLKSLFDTWNKLVRGGHCLQVWSHRRAYIDGICRWFAIEPFCQTLSSYDFDRTPHEITRIIEDIARGLRHLHCHGIIHGTLSPREVVVRVRSDIFEAKITKLVVGDDDWGLPTASHNEDTRRLGCIAYWLLSGGHHPFGDSEDRQHRLRRNEYTVENLTPLAEHLVLTLINSKSDKDVVHEKEIRLSSAILDHSFFWSQRKVDGFFRAAFDAIDSTSMDNVYTIEWTNGPVSKLKDWLRSRKLIPRTNVEAITLYASIVRDYKKGRSDLPAELAADFPECFVDAWNSLYPELLVDTWIGLQRHRNMRNSNYYCKFNFEPQNIKFTFCEPTDPRLEDVFNEWKIMTIGKQFYLTLQLTHLNAEQMLRNPLDDRQRTFLHLVSHSDKLIDLAEELRLLGGLKAIEVQDVDGFTPLHFAVCTNSYLVANLIIKEKASVNIKDKLYGLTPLLMALLRDLNWMAKLLLNCESIDVNSENRDGLTALHIAVAKKNLDMVEYLLQVNGIDANAQDKLGRTPLHFAAGKNAFKIVQELLKHGADVCVTERQGLTPLDVAVVTSCDIELIESLLNANPDVVNKKDALGPNPLHLAINSQSIQTVELLLMRQADPEAFDKFGWRSLHHAARTGSVQLVDLLLKNGVQVDALDFQFNSALHIAVHRGCVDVVRLLLNSKADPNHQNHLGQSPLHVALQFNRSTNHLEIVQILLQFKADPNLEARNGCNALQCAVQFNSVEGVKCLLTDGRVDIESRHPELKFTALHLAAAFNRTEIAEILVDKGANIEAGDVNGETPIYYAAFFKSVDVARLLIEKSATVNIQKFHGRSPLHVAAARDAVSVGQVLITAGADVNARDDLNLTPLHYAKFHRNARFMGLFHGESVDRLGKSELTPDDFDQLHSVVHYLKRVKPVTLKVRPKVEFSFDWEACGKVDSSRDHRDMFNNRISFGA